MSKAVKEKEELEKRFQAEIKTLENKMEMMNKTFKQLVE